ncbi:internalin [Thalassomonas viridans]|uniref:Internalin n=1 Tax=Thalassomonas viridans TaxID=137584 RepID=A0AAF0CAX4_9GAMM|nr:hypothetical protein [Thalassomonas viridans]WDE07006.1 internalin [Thalassomonas viridans]
MNSFVNNLACGKFARLTALASVMALPALSNIGLAQASQIPATVSDHIVLGTAYDSGREKFLNHQPVAGCVHLSGNTEANVTYKNDTSYDDVLSMLNGGVEVGIDFPVVRANAGATLATETASSKYVSSFSLYSYVSPPKEKYSPVDVNKGYTLSTTGNELVQQTAGEIYDVAGDEFVSEISYGAYMLVNMRIEYLNERDKLEIGGELDVDIAGGVVNVNGRLNYLDEEEKQSVRIVVRSLQNGGDPLALFQTIPSNIMACTLENPAPCFDLLKRSVDYAKNTFPDQLRVIQGSDQGCKSILDPSENAGYNVVSYTTSRYDQASVELLQLVDQYEPINWTTTTLIRDHEKDYKAALIDQERAERLLTEYGVWLDDTHAEQLKVIKAQANNNAWLHYRIAQYCRDNPYGTACHDYNSQVDNECNAQSADNMCFASYDEALLKVESDIDQSSWSQCETARSKVAQSGSVQDSVTQNYRALGWAPVLIDNANPVSGVSAWMPCGYALTTYGDHFKG